MFQAVLVLFFTSFRTVNPFTWTSNLSNRYSCLKHIIPNDVRELYAETPKQEEKVGDFIYNPKLESIHLVSLPPITRSQTQSLRDLWKWKDVALGDGRDYFIPRPRAIGTLQNNFLQFHDTNDCLHAQDNKIEHRVKVSECSILSNCARFDILLVLRLDDPPQDKFFSSNKEELELKAKIIAANVLLDQLVYYDKSKYKNSALTQSLTTAFDLPGIVYDSSSTKSTTGVSKSFKTEEYKDKVNEIAGYLDYEGDIQNITKHTCLVASGIALRPSRPERDVPFRPYSSRDAHIMLQIKRTVEICQGKKLKTILEASLQAGKASRDSSKVPEIAELKNYNSGEGGRYSKPEAPKKLVKKATLAANEKAIKPAVSRCIQKLIAMESSDAISRIRQNAQDIVLRCQNIDEKSDAHNERTRQREMTTKVNKILHEPTVLLREGKYVNEESVLNKVKEALETYSNKK